MIFPQSDTTKVSKQKVEGSYYLVGQLCFSEQERAGRHHRFRLPSAGPLPNFGVCNQGHPTRAPHTRRQRPSTLFTPNAENVVLCYEISLLRQLGKVNPVSFVRRTDAISNHIPYRSGIDLPIVPLQFKPKMFVVTMCLNYLKHQVVDVTCNPWS